MRLLSLFLFPLLATSCAYNMGYRYYNLPGDFKEISIPMFVNESLQVGAEVHFTNELKNQFFRSRIAKVSPNASAKIVGKIRRIYVDQNRALTTGGGLPSNTVLTTSYNVTIDVEIKLIRISDKKVIWQTVFSDYRPFSGAQLKAEGVASSNSIYNQSALDDNIRKMADIMMAQAHSRLTENF